MQHQWFLHSTTRAVLWVGASAAWMTSCGRVGYDPSEQLPLLVPLAVTDSDPPAPDPTPSTPSTPPTDPVDPDPEEPVVLPEPDPAPPTPVCGNGVVETGESCDDAGQSADCEANCQSSGCGDGVVNVFAGEECDDPDSETCTASCLRIPPPPAPDCGDGTIDVAAGEACDDGGESPTCNADCSLAQCGDGILNPSAGEECETGGVETPDCNLDCTSASCGDGVVNLAAGEQCEVSDAGCDSMCQSGLEALIVRDDNISHDGLVFDHLAALGFSVSEVRDHSAVAADADGMSLVVISPTADWRDLGATFRDVAVPVVVLEWSIYAQQDFGDVLAVGDNLSVDVVGQHPIAGALSGNQQIWTSLGDRGRAGANLPATLVIATSPAEGRPMIFAYEAGAQMESIAAPARRVGFGPGKVSHGMTSTAWEMFDQAVLWAVDAPVPIYESCEELMRRHPTLADGLYTIRPGGSDLAANCVR